MEPNEGGQTLPLAQLLQPGLTVLAGQAKVGKSWLCLDLAAAVATGGHALGVWRATPGQVLYMALDDTPGRIQRRLQQYRQGSEETWPATLHFRHQVPTWAQGGREGALQWLREAENARLMILDPWMGAMPNSSPHETYQLGLELSRLGQEHEVTVLTTATASLRDGPMRIYPEALASAADTILGLTREFGRIDAQLLVFGREVPECEYPLTWAADEGRFVTRYLTAVPAGLLGKSLEPPQPPQVIPVEATTAEGTPSPAIVDQINEAGEETAAEDTPEPEKPKPARRPVAAAGAKGGEAGTKQPQTSVAGTKELKSAGSTKAGKSQPAEASAKGGEARTPAQKAAATRKAKAKGGRAKK